MPLPINSHITTQHQSRHYPAPVMTLPSNSHTTTQHQSYHHPAPVMPLPSTSHTIIHHHAVIPLLVMPPKRLLMPPKRLVMSPKITSRNLNEHEWECDWVFWGSSSLLSSPHPFICKSWGVVVVPISFSSIQTILFCLPPFSVCCEWMLHEKPQASICWKWTYQSVLRATTTTTQLQSCHYPATVMPIPSTCHDTTQHQQYHYPAPDIPLHSTSHTTTQHQSYHCPAPVMPIPSTSHATT